MQKYCPLCKVIQLYETCDKKFQSFQSMAKYGKVLCHGARRGGPDPQSPTSRGGTITNFHGTGLFFNVVGYK